MRAPIIKNNQRLKAEGLSPDTVKPVASYGGEDQLADGSLDVIPVELNFRRRVTQDVPGIVFL